jgi:hypothetical protein
MSTAWIIRGAKIAAILGFLLPWVVVSCQGTQLSSATGIQLVLGQSTAASGAGAQTTTTNPGIMQQLPFIIALLAIIAGLAISFLQRGKQAGQITLTTSGVALVASIGGYMLLEGFIKGQLNQQGGQAAPPPSASSDPYGDAFAQQMNQMGQGMAQMIQVQPQSGYWLTLIALIVAGAASFLLMQGREQIGGSAAPPPS